MYLYATLSDPQWLSHSVLNSDRETSYKYNEEGKSAGWREWNEEQNTTKEKWRIMTKSMTTENILLPQIDHLFKYKTPYVWTVVTETDPQYYECCEITFVQCIIFTNIIMGKQWL